MLSVYTPFLHHLLLARDRLREEFKLPGGIAVVEEEMRARASGGPLPDPSEEYVRLYTYTRGVNYNPVWGFTTPLVLAVQQGNVDAVNLLLLFGEPVNDTVKGCPPPLYTAVEHGTLVAGSAHPLPARSPCEPRAQCV